MSDETNLGSNKAPWWIWPLVAMFGMGCTTVVAAAAAWAYLAAPPRPAPSEPKADLARLVWDDDHRADLAGYFDDLAAFLSLERRPLSTTADFQSLQTRSSEMFIVAAELPAAGTYTEASREIGRRIKSILTDNEYPLDDERNLRSLLVRELSDIARDLES